MHQAGERIFYHRNLPHFQPPDSTYSVVIRLAGSLPTEIIQQLRHDRERFRKNLAGIKKEKRAGAVRQLEMRIFKKYDLVLDRVTSGPRWLSNPEVAEIVQNAIHYWDNQVYELLAHSIMINHVHIVFSIGEASNVKLAPSLILGPTGFPVTDVMTSIKKYSARRANKVLSRSGSFWQDESYDHVVRENEFEASIRYVLQNPVKAGLVRRWSEWPWNYLKEGIIEM